MASYTFVFLLLSALHISAVVAAHQRSSNISLGSSLSPSSTNSPSSWLSPSGRFAFGFYPKGNGFAIGIWFAQIPQHTVVWTSNRDDPPYSSDATLCLTSNGSFLLRDTAQDIEKSIADYSEPASWATMLDTGNFVLYNSTGSILWQTFTLPTDTLLPGQFLHPLAALFSSVSETDHSTGLFMLDMQFDGNLVQYPNESPQTIAKAYWASGTDGQEQHVTLHLDDDGHLYLINRTGFTIYNLFPGNPTDRTVFYRMTIDVDGIFRVYSISMYRKGSWSINWESSTDKCDPKGICGLNAYCTFVNQTAICKCIPGFSFIDESLHSLGCERKRNNEGHRNETMSVLENTVWDEENLYYSWVSSKTERECNEACLADKYCVATSFEATSFEDLSFEVLQDLQCRKLSFPFRYGRAIDRPVTPIFVKVSI